MADLLAVNANFTSTAAATGAATLLAANGRRAGFSIQNDGTGTLSILMDNHTTAASTVSATNRSVAIAAGAYWESPYNYQGAVTAISSVASGNVQVTEYLHG